MDLSSIKQLKKIKMRNSVLDIEQNQFIWNSLEYWKKMKTGTSKEVNETVKDQKKIVARWKRKSLVEERLSPLLRHKSPEVRFAAAAFMLDQAENSEALEIIRNFVASDQGLISVSAAAILRVRGISAV